MAFFDGFAGAFLIVLRESLEAFLIIGILTGIVLKLGRPEGRRPLWLGALAGIVVSMLLGIVSYDFARELNDQYGALFEGVATLLAVGILTYMIVWMYRHTMGMVGTLHDKAKAALDAGKPFVLFALAFVVVIREGIETVVFIGSQVARMEPAAVWVAVVIGMTVSLGLALLLFRGVVRLSVEKFFAVTGAILVIIAGGLLGYATHELSEVYEPLETPRAFDASGFLPHKCPEADDGTVDVTPGCVVGGFLFATIGYRATPAVLDIGVWAAYVGGMLYWYLRPRREHPVHKERPPAEPQQGPEFG